MVQPGSSTAAGQPASKLLEAAVVACVSSFGFYLLAKFVNNRWFLDTLLKELRKAHDDLEHEQEKRKSERAGRIRAEQELRKLQLQAATAQLLTAGAAASTADSADAAAASSPASTSDQAPAVYPFKPIGYIRSCFSQRNGTPRQPLLVEAARSQLTLLNDVPADCLEGLKQYSHVWLLYVFHCNTDLAKTLGGPARSGLKAKIQVPRLNGAKMGVLATRSPHRPVPIGLSVARVLAVQGNSLLLGGADVVDGSPVLDVKPYVPFCDAVAGATAPAWVAAEVADEPLHVDQVVWCGGAQQELEQCWQACRPRSLYPDPASFRDLVQQVLSRDIRSVHQRLSVGSGGAAGSLSTAAAGAGNSGTMAAAAAAAAVEAPPQPPPSATTAAGKYHVVLEGVDFRYDIDPAGVVCVQGATLAALARQEATETS